MTLQAMDFLPLALDEGYADFIVRHSQNVRGVLSDIPQEQIQLINETYSVLYMPLTQVSGVSVDNYSYNTIPDCYTYMDTQALIASRIVNLQNHPYLKLNGEKTAIAIIDSGIDYTHPAFLTYGKTRIAYLWDQSIPSDNGAVPYGSEYTQEQIDEALEAEDPWKVVPSRDENGHGTFLAGIAAGTAQPDQEFSGAAPESTLIVVKLKQAKEYLRKFYFLPDGVDFYQENDIMFAVTYAIHCAKQIQMPLVICIGLGNNQGTHRGENPLAITLDNVTRNPQTVVAVAAGNEGNARHHYEGVIRPDQEEATVVELRVGEEKKGFFVEFWGSSLNLYRMQLQSPSGEKLEISTARGMGAQTLSFVFVETKVEVGYSEIELQSGGTLIFFRFMKPVSGIWRFLVSSENENLSETVTFHMWLPVYTPSQSETYFLQSSPYNTITNPGGSRDAITVTAYNDRDGSLYLEASRGYAPNGYVKPDLAAPGVMLTGPAPQSRYVQRSGTSVAAALTAGALALLMEWAVVRGNAPYLNGTSAKYYLTRGAVREDGESYPNPDWGYGKLDLYRVFELLT